MDISVFHLVPKYFRCPNWVKSIAYDLVLILELDSVLSDECPHLLLFTSTTTVTPFSTSTPRRPMRAKYAIAAASDFWQHLATFANPLVHSSICILVWTTYRIRIFISLRHVEMENFLSVVFISSTRRRWFLEFFYTIFMP